MNISYRNQTYLGATKVSLKKIGEYNIGGRYTSTYNSYVEGGETKYNDYDQPCQQTPRNISIFRNYANLPYTYNKFWDGSVYAFEGGINAGGLEGWSEKNSLAFGMKGEIRGVFLNDIIEIAAGRMNREWAGMDEGVSLVLNANARPFFDEELILRPFKWFSLNSMISVLEMPNRKDKLSTDFYTVDSDGYSTEEELDRTNAHKEDYQDYRYAFPLIDRIVYQNDVGDYHAADFDSQSVPRSNLYSELPLIGRKELRKNFLFDGAYEWSHIRALSGSYKFNTKLPMIFSLTAGVIYDYFTSIADQTVSIYQDQNRFGVEEDNFYINEGDYKSSLGGVVSLSITLFGGNRF